MKRQTIFCAAALSAAFCISLAGCAGTTADNNAIADAERMTGIEVTEEQWSEALAYFLSADAEYTVQGEMNMERSEYALQYNYPDYSIHVMMRASVKDGKVHLQNTYTSTMSDEEIAQGFAALLYPEQYIVAPQDDSYVYPYYIKDKDGKWSKTTLTLGEGETLGDVAFGCILGIQSPRFGLGSKLDQWGYQQYHYDAEKGGYIPVEKNIIPHTFKFAEVDGKVRLTSLYINLDGVQSSYVDWEQAWLISYSAPDIVLPEVEE